MPQPTLVIHPHFKTSRLMGRTLADCLEEAVGLAHAIDLEVREAVIAAIAAPRPATLFGSGKVEEIAGRVKEGGIGLAVVDTSLSPVQQRNLEKAWNCKVIDRTALILEIFGARARTSEGKLQVELASLEYQKGRLVRSWTHLERQRGGFGFLGGPGESQIEVDRRMIRDRIAKIRRELETVTRTRELHRKTRRDVPYPVVALVGYTNAGKSTLFNRLTGANVKAMDKLFATLDPTMRALKLPSGFTIILSDTVGFVSNLPHELVAAFRATLEEVLEADLLLHVRDAAGHDSEAQKKDVEHVLRQLFDLRSAASPPGGAQPAALNEPSPRLRSFGIGHVIEVLNKADKLPEDDRKPLMHVPGKIIISALTGEGVENLLEAVDRRLRQDYYQETSLTLRQDDGQSYAWLHRHGRILSESRDGEVVHLAVCMTEDNLHRFRKLFGERLQ